MAGTRNHPNRKRLSSGRAKYQRKIRPRTPPGGIESSSTRPASIDIGSIRTALSNLDSRRFSTLEMDPKRDSKAREAFQDEALAFIRNRYGGDTNDTVGKSPSSVSKKVNAGTISVDLTSIIKTSESSESDDRQQALFAMLLGYEIIIPASALNPNENSVLYEFLGEIWDESKFKIGISPKIEDNSSNIGGLLEKFRTPAGRLPRFIKSLAENYPELNGDFGSLTLADIERDHPELGKSIAAYAARYAIPVSDVLPTGKKVGRPRKRVVSINLDLLTKEEAAVAEAWARRQPPPSGKSSKKPAP